VNPKTCSLVTLITTQLPQALITFVVNDPKPGSFCPETGALAPTHEPRCRVAWGNRSSSALSQRQLGHSSPVGGLVETVTAS
jgi:hypothetical protein